MLLSQGAISGSNLIFTLGTVYVFGPANFGVISFYMLIALMLVNVATAIFIEPAVSIAARVVGFERRAYFTALGVGYVLLVILLLIPSFYLLIFIDNYTITSPNKNIVLITGFIWLFVTAGITRAFLQAFARPQLLLRADLARSSLVIMALCISIFFSSSSQTISPIDLVVYLQVVALVGYLTGLFIYAGLRRVFVGPLLSHIKDHVSKSILSGPIAIVRFWQVNSPLFFSQLLLGEDVFGVIRACQTVANVVSIPLYALRIRLMSNGAKTYIDGGSPLLEGYIFSEAFRLFLMTGALGLLLVIALWVMPVGLVPISSGLMLIVLFTCANIVISANTAFTSYFFSQGNLAPILYRLLVILLLSFTLSPILIRAFGQYGVPFGMFLAAAMSLIWTGFLIRRDSELGTKSDDLL